MEISKLHSKLQFPIIETVWCPFTDHAVQARKYNGHLETAKDEADFTALKNREVRGKPRATLDEYNTVYQRVQDGKRSAINIARAAMPHLILVSNAAQGGWPRSTDWKTSLEAAHQTFRLYSSLLHQLKALTGNLYFLIPLVDTLHTDGMTKAYAKAEHKYYEADVARAQNVANYCQDIFQNPDLPPRADGGLKILEGALPASKKDAFLKLRFATHTGYHPRSIDGSPDWEGAWRLGEGGFGTVALWVKNINGTINGVVACKDNKMRRAGWTDITRWEFSTDNDWIPTEIYCQHLLKGSGLVPELHHYHIDDLHMQYIMYLEYCPFQDLAALMGVYRNTGMPEPFLWMTFLRLAQAGFAMEFGHQNYSNPSRAEGWKKPIIHRDLKPANVFLSHPNPNEFPLYPSPVLGDFGLAIMVEKDHDWNPNVYLDGGGTPGYYAPEQRAYVDYRTDEPVDRYQFSAQTNVWGFGKIMYSITALDRNQRQPDFMGEPDSDALDIKREHPMAVMALSNYSDELLDLINKCLKQDPDERPTCYELVHTISNAIENQKATKEMRDSNATTAIAPNDARRLRVTTGRYKQGMTRADLGVPNA